MDWLKAGESAPRTARQAEIALGGLLRILSMRARWPVGRPIGMGYRRFGVNGLLPNDRRVICYLDHSFNLGRRASLARTNTG